MEPQPLTAAERVAQLIKTLEISPYQFGKETGLSHQTISNVLTGKNRPSLDTLEAIAARYPDTAIWLLTGTGEPRTGRALSQLPPPLPPPIREGLPAVPGTATATEVRFVDRLIRNLEEENAKKDALIEWLQDQNAVLLGKSPASAYAAAAYAEPRTPVAGFVLNQGREAVMRTMYPAPLKQVA